MVETEPYIYEKYIKLIIERFENGLIYEDKLQQFLETIVKWESKLKKLSENKKKVVMNLLTIEGG